MSTASSASMIEPLSLASAKYAAPAFSREAARKSGGEVEALAVPGVRPRFAKSFETKREFQTVKDVLAAEYVGRFPHGNFADTLQRVSGVSIARELGEGERVSNFNYLMLPI